MELKSFKFSEKKVGGSYMILKKHSESEMDTERIVIAWFPHKLRHMEQNWIPISNSN